MNTKPHITICGDALEVMKTIETNSIDLVFTSPPYADRRKKSYDWIVEGKYVEWNNIKQCTQDEAESYKYFDVSKIE